MPYLFESQRFPLSNPNLLQKHGAGIGGDAAAVVGEAVSFGAATPAAIPLAIGSTGLILHGGSTISKSLDNMKSEGTNTGRGKNHLEPDKKNASGDHSTFRTDPQTGKTINTATYKQNSQNPKTGFDEVKRVDVVGAPHKSKITGQDIPTPHVHEPKLKDPRPALPHELPRQ